MADQPRYSASRLLEIGRLADAMGILRAERTARPADIATQLRIAELAALAGDGPQALRIAQGLATSKAATVEQQIRAATVVAQISIDRGRAREAYAQLKETVRRAADAKLWRCRTWAELWLLTALGDFASASDIRGFLRDLRHHVNQLGDPLTTIALHLFVAEAESRRGVLDSSVQHVRVARTLLVQHPNHWLESLAAIDALCLAYMRSDSESAEHECSVAMRASFEAGAEKSKLAVVANSGTVSLAAGKLAEAERQFKAAMRLSKVAPRWRSSIIDGMCQLELARGNLGGARNLFDQLGEPFADALAYQSLWPQLTGARLEIACGNLGAARSMADAALANALSVGDRELTVRLRLLSAEAAAHDGDVTAASEAFLAAALGHPSPSLELVAERNRVAGLVLDASGDAEAAHLRLERSRRMLEGIGHTRAAADIARALDARPSPTPGAARERPDITAARAAALFEQASRADLLALELADLLFDTGAVRALAVVTVDGDGAPRIVSTRGWNDADALAALEHPTALPRLALGSWRNLQWSLLADVPPAATARAAFVAVRTLADGALTVNEARRAERERSALWPIDPVDDATHGVFASESMLDLVKTIRRVAATPVTMLLTGETGTGKDVLAQLIHEYSPRASRPFVPFNCTAVPREMLDSQLFGHRRGAFTGAQEQSPGVIRGAQGGTLFLDEIGELGPEPQVKLLRFLESSEVHPIGEPHPVHVDVRVVAATNRDLEALVKDGLFREDLYYRLNVVRLRVPPLRERREEIPLIVDHYLTRFGPQFKKGQLTASSETMEYLLLHSWPGNVRQLANELRRAAALAEPDSVIVPEHLSPEVLASRRTMPAGRHEPLPTELLVRLDQPLDAAVEHLERALLHHAMQVSHGHMDQAAQLLGLSRKGLYLKRQRLGLEPSGPAVPRLDGRPGGPPSGDESLPH